MSKLTDGSENDCADCEYEMEDPFSQDEMWSSGDEINRDSKLKRSFADGRNLNKSFGQYDANDWDHLHYDKGMNPQFLVLRSDQKQQ